MNYKGLIKHKDDATFIELADYFRYKGYEDNFANGYEILFHNEGCDEGIVVVTGVEFKYDIYEYCKPQSIYNVKRNLMSGIFVKDLILHIR